MNDKSVVIHKFHAPHTAEEIRDQVTRIQEVMRGVMKSKTHYDVIPGTGGKPSLLKPGAEMLLTTFRISVQPEIIDLSAAGEIRYQVRAHGIHMGTQVTVGIGIGECSSSEEKYAWRAAVCQEEFDDTPESHRRIKYKSGYGGGGVDKIPQVRTNPSDAANTILKMAKKRAEVDLCLTALACSDIFTQDMGEGDDQQRPIDHPKAGSQAPRRTSSGTGTATEKQQGLLAVKCDQQGIGVDSLCRKFGVDDLSQLPFDKVNDALAWIANGGD